jgi:hypothetical protein
VSRNLEHEINVLDQLLAILARGSASPEAQLSREHLEAARWYLLGAMYAEYSFSLSLAHETVERIPDRETQAKAKVVIAQLNANEESPSARFPSAPQDSGGRAND